jgi:hypothetical protein
MARDWDNEKQHAHQLIDQLPATHLSAVVGLLEAMLDPISRAVADAPAEEDEELKPEMAAVIERARASLARGESIPHEEILREFGLRKRPNPLRRSASRSVGHRKPGPIFARSTANGPSRFSIVWTATSPAVLVILRD